jgi:hypothetical protein
MGRLNAGPDRNNIRMQYYYGPGGDEFGGFTHMTHKKTWWRVCVVCYPDYIREKILLQYISNLSVQYCDRNNHNTNGFHKYSDYDIVEYIHFNIDCKDKETAVELMEKIKQLDEQYPVDHKYTNYGDFIMVTIIRDTKEEIDDFYEWCRHTLKMPNNNFKPIINFKDNNFNSTSRSLMQFQWIDKYYGRVLILPEQELIFRLAWTAK